MKKSLILFVGALAILAVTYMALAQESGDRAQRWARMREAQLKAIETIQQQAEKLKTGMEEAEKARESRGSFQEISEDERTKMREQFRQRREEQETAIQAIEEALVSLKGPRRLREEHDQSLNQLRELRTIAAQENAEKTIKAIDDIISVRDTKFDETIQKLGFGFGQRP
jgi:TolA-binding protein